MEARFEDLSDKQKEFWNNLADNLSPLQEAFIALHSRKKCIWCKKEFDEGIIRKHPGKFIDTSAYKWFTSEFLVHAQTTHGYSPDIIDIFLSKIA